MNYGISYQGSKSGIAEWVVAHLPRSLHLYDLFAGGCAITHRALLTSRFQYIHANDLNDTPMLFKNAIEGKYRNESRWISREDFFRLKDQDPYIRTCWSFGNNGENYIYGRDIEMWKKAVHLLCFGTTDYTPADICHMLYSRVFTLPDGTEYRIQFDYEAIADLLACPNRANRFKLRDIPFTRTILNSLNPPQTILNILKLHKTTSNNLECLQSLQSLQRLQSLQSLRYHTGDRLTVTQGDYEAVAATADTERSVFYCDIPYTGTDCRQYGGFDHARFYEWAKRQTVPLFISEYSMPEADFVCVAETQKRVLSTGADGNGQTATERLFRPRHQLQSEAAAHACPMQLSFRF